MGKMEQLRRSSAINVAESMGAMFDSPTTPFVPVVGGVRPTPQHLVGVTRSKNVAQIELDRIGPDPDQPREEFDEESLERLAESLKTRGQLQPIRVRWDLSQNQYVIICGERRWRAAKLAGMPSMACVIVDGVLTPSELLAMQLVENALREDLRPVEQARAFKMLMDENGWSTRQIARELAITQPQVVRALSLLNLPDDVQEQVEQGTLAPATAYEIGKLEDQTDQAALAQQVVHARLTREEAAAAVRRRKEVKARAAREATRPEPVELRVSDGVIVTVRYRKADRLTVVQALRLALKQAQAKAQAEAEAEADLSDHEEETAA